MVSRAAVLDVLRTVNDPEMPINIVDLGMVEAVRLKKGSGAFSAKEKAPDPSFFSVDIDLLPTFVGCPALHVIEEEVRRRVGALPGVAEVRVHVRFDPPWTVDRVSEAGRAALRQAGVTVPGVGEDAAPTCPFCGSAVVRLDSPFGPTRCRMIYYCEACKNPFEHLKRVGGTPALLGIGVPRRPPDSPR